MTLLQLLGLAVSFIYTANGQDSITIDSLHVQSEIRHRYAVTLVTSQISNMADFAQDVKFDVQLPKEAFISNFTMTIGGKVYPGEVAEKAAAAKKFEKAVSSGQSAGLVATKSARETNNFTVSVNVEASSNVTFNLTYQELLQRRTGLYEHVIYINPGVIVPDLRVEVFINESREITELTVPEVRGDQLTSSVISGSNKFAQIESISATVARVTFAPTPEQQQEYSDRGVSGQFIVNYDVNHDISPEGEILTSNGYFVHFFAPENLPPLGKRIIFVLDTSGSMGGTKIRELREALLYILGELRPIDGFGIVLFNRRVQTWGSVELIPASPENIRRAKDFARTLSAGGGTNINGALVWGLNALSEHPTKPSMLLFLTDGQATFGETNSQKILENVGEVRLARQAIYSLAFGRGADFDLIRKISAQNRGFARRIYEDADASLQLAGFYNEISTPVLSDVRITYLNDTVDPETLTVTTYPWFFRGSEIVVTGRFANISAPEGNETRSLDVSIEGSKGSSRLSVKKSLSIWPCWRPRPCPRCFRYPCPPCLPYPCPPYPPKPTPRPDPKPGPIQDRNDFVERLWVYLTIKQLVRKTLQESDSSSKTVANAKAKIVELSLKYNFVTPYTSMVVTRPSQNKTVTTLRESSNQGQVDTTINRRVVAGVGALRPSSLKKKSGLQFYRRFRIKKKSGLQFYRRFPSIVSSSVSGVNSGPVGGFFPAGALGPPPKPLPTTVSPPTSRPTVKYFASGVNVEVNLTTLAGQPNRTILCLDVAAGSPADAPQILLLNDTLNGVLLSAVLHSSDYEGFRKFSEIQLTLNGTTDVTISTKSIVIGSTTYRWWQVRSLSLEGLRVTDNDGIELTTDGSVILTFHKFGLESRRSLSSPYMTVSAKNTDGLSPSATGLLVGVVELKDVQQTGTNVLSYTQSGNNGRRQESLTSEDKTLEGERCLRIQDVSALTSILSR